MTDTSRQLDLFDWCADPVAHVIGRLAHLIDEGHTEHLAERLERLAGAWACIDGHRSPTLADVKRVAVVMFARYRPNGSPLGASAVVEALKRGGLHA